MTIEVESTQVAEIFEKDINKLCEDINTVIEAHNILVDENAELKNIIKEVREYIEIIVRNTPSSTRKDYANMLLIDYKKLLEILDKVDKEVK